MREVRTMINVHTFLNKVGNHFVTHTYVLIAISKARSRVLKGDKDKLQAT